MFLCLCSYKDLPTSWALATDPSSSDSFSVNEVIRTESLSFHFFPKPYATQMLRRISSINCRLQRQDLFDCSLVVLCLRRRDEIYVVNSCKEFLEKTVFNFTESA